MSPIDVDLGPGLKAQANYIDIVALGINVYLTMARANLDLEEKGLDQEVMKSTDVIKIA